jgi:hypothetical protein
MKRTLIACAFVALTILTSHAGWIVPPMSDNGSYSGPDGTAYWAHGTGSYSGTDGSYMTWNRTGFTRVDPDGSRYSCRW